MAAAVCLVCAAAVSADRPLGLDVSNWQGTISPAQWIQVYSSGWVFAFTKATEGTTYSDPTFANNMTNGRAAGLYMGAYHFAHPDLNAATAEANYFVSVAGPYLTSGYLRPALDLEVGSSIGRTALSQWVNDWINAVQQQTGAEPIVYCNTNYATNYLDSTVSSRTLWIANWPTSPNPQTGNPPTGVWSTWNFWQYADNGSVPGISGNVDLDVFNGTFSQLQTFLINGTPPPAISLSPPTLAPKAMYGWNAPSQTFTVTNSGGGTLNYSITDDVTWLVVNPTAGTSTGEPETITITYSTAALTTGTYTGTISISDPTAAHSPQTVTVTLTISPPGDFNYDGYIDQTDVSIFQGCMSGPGVQQTSPACPNEDLDRDGDVDQSDFGLLQRCLSAPGVPADLNCAN